MKKFWIDENSYSRMWKDRYLFPGLLLFAVVLVAILIVCGRTVSHHLDANSCKKFGRETNREVKFVTFNYLDWDCFTKTPTNGWVPTSQMLGVESN